MPGISLLVKESLDILISADLKSFKYFFSILSKFEEPLIINLFIFEKQFI